MLLLNNTYLQSNHMVKSISQQLIMTAEIKTTEKRNNILIRGWLFILHYYCRPTFYRVYRKKSTEGFQSTPYVVTLFSCMLWIFYALLKSGAELLVTINGVGCVIETVYLGMYLVYAPRAARVLTAKMLLGLNVGVFGLVALVTMVLSNGGLRVHVLGWICVSVALSVFAAPLSIMVRTYSCKYLPQ